MSFDYSTAGAFLFIFYIGAVFGSFLTAWIWRLNQDRSMLEKHSECPNCHHQLVPLDLLPVVSYIFLLGKCRYCRKPISSQYILIELATGSIFVLSTLHILSLLPTPYSLLAPWPLVCLIFIWATASLLVALFVYDLRWGYLPDIWTLGGSVLTLAITIIATIFNQPLLWQVSSSGLLPTLASGAVAGLFFLLIVWGSEKLLHKPGMGLGDVKLALFMGLFLGYPAIIVAVYIAFILGAVLSLLLLASKQKSFGQSLPFGPFLVIGTIAAVWLTPIVVNWYQALIL